MPRRRCTAPKQRRYGGCAGESSSWPAPNSSAAVADKNGGWPTTCLSVETTPNNGGEQGPERPLRHHYLLERRDHAQQWQSRLGGTERRNGCLTCLQASAVC